MRLNTEICKALDKTINNYVTIHKNQKLPKSFSLMFNVKQQKEKTKKSFQTSSLPEFRCKNANKKL